MATKPGGASRKKVPGVCAVCRVDVYDAIRHYTSRSHQDKAAAWDRARRADRERSGVMALPLDPVTSDEMFPETYVPPFVTSEEVAELASDVIEVTHGRAWAHVAVPA